MDVPRQLLRYIGFHSVALPSLPFTPAVLGVTNILAAKEGKRAWSNTWEVFKDQAWKWPTFSSLELIQLFTFNLKDG